MTIDYSERTMPCPECDNLILNSAKRCKCGWKKSVSEKQPKTDYRCSIVENGRRCESTVKPWRCNHPHEPALFWCGEHYELRRKKSDIDVEVDRRAKMFAEMAKKDGVSNYEFCKQYLGKSNIGRQVLKGMENK